jgi:hypothetical protein
LSFEHSNLTPCVPLSDFNDIVHTEISGSERGRVFERGLRPLSLRLPSPARNNSGFLHNTGWRGVRGEVTLFNHVPTDPQAVLLDTP